MKTNAPSQKSMVEGSMNIIFKAAKYFDLQHNSTDKKEKHKYETSLEMIIPVVKTYPSEAGIYSINNGLQFLGVMVFVQTLFYNNIIVI